MRGHYRHTKIIATVGPATESDERLGQLITAGVDVLRLNMAHGTGEWAAALIKRVRAVSSKLGRHVAVMMDVKGPEIRTAAIAEPIDLRVGDAFELYTTTPTPGRARRRRQLPRAADGRHVGTTILVDSGLIRLSVIEIDETHVRCRVLTPASSGRDATSTCPASTSTCRP